MTTSPKATATRQYDGFVCVPVLPEKRDALRRLLSQIGDETVALMRGTPVSDPIIAFDKLEAVHYARFVLLEHDPKTGPVLAFSTNYDGPEGDDTCSRSRALDFHTKELVRVAQPGLDRVFSHCKNYRPGQLETFFKKRQQVASTFYNGTSGRSRNQILWERELRHNVDAILDKNAIQWNGKPPSTVRGQVREKLKSTYSEIPKFPAQPNLSGKVRRFEALLGAVALLVLVRAFVLAWVSLPLPASFGFSFFWDHLIRGFSVLGLMVLILAVPICLLALYFRHLEKTDPQFQPTYNEAAHEHFDRVSVGENEFLQNQLTHLAYVKPGILRWLLIRGVFYALQVLATNTYNRGKLGGIPSIHFARWVLLPNRALLFFSNFDSSWQSYLGDFIDQASSGLTAVWSNTNLYPRSKWLVSSGSRDAARFLAWTRAHQLPTQVWYSAYPGVSTVNVNNNTEIRRGLADDQAMDAATWLFHLRSVDRFAVDELHSEARAQEAPLVQRDIQGMVLKGFGYLPEARYLMLRVTDAVKDAADPESLAKVLRFLGDLPLASAEHAARAMQPRGPLVNVAFTYEGMRALKIDEHLCNRFSTPFVQGSDHDYRARVNGDVGINAPDQWRWGAGDKTPHVLLAVFDSDKTMADAAEADYTERARKVGFELLLGKALEGTTLEDRKEHFGFRDGISQPAVRGSGREELEGNTIEAGEILLGYRDGYGNVTHSPESSSGFAFGYNGSYMVFRQLKQEVEDFWIYCKGDEDGDSAVTVASKMVGRWPSGASLVRHPDKEPDDPRFADEASFSYLANGADNDRYGARCPFGAHTRRSNPRDWQLGETPKASIELSNHHRIIRRGRPYGPPLVASMKPQELIDKASALRANGAQGTEPERGLQFICFNANIDRQFEFVQQQWLSNPKFAGLESDADPLLGPGRPPQELGLRQQSFTTQTDVRTQLHARRTEMKGFVSVVGSAYFFMPSLPAMRLLRDGLPAAPHDTDGLETVPPDEQVHINSLIDTLRDKMKQDYSGRQTLRGAHPKMHGCVTAQLTIEPNLDETLAQGLFSKPKTYQALVRFSNANGEVQDDAKPDIRGAAIKLLGVPGPKLLDGEEDSVNHDLLLITHETFLARDVAEFDEFTKALIGDKVPGYLLGHPRFALRVLGALKKHSSPLEVPYFSAVPYLLGSRAVKYQLRPSSPEKTPIPSKPSPDYLRETMRARLSSQSVSFDFMVQLQSDSASMPIEDSTVVWSQKKSPFRKVATLTIAAQEFDTDERREMGENLAYNPWRCWPEHRPLGGMSRARRQIYRALASFRHLRNATRDKIDSPVEVRTDEANPSVSSIATG